MAMKPGGARDKKKNATPQYRTNEQIRAREVRIVGEDIETRVVNTRTALDMAKEQGLDLVEISPNAEPPVCRLVDYSKFLYQIKKKQKELKAKQVRVEVKEIRLGSQIGEADYNFKLKHAAGFIAEGNKVKCTVTFRGRSFIFKDQGEILLLKFAAALDEVAKVESMPALEGRRMSIILAPKKSSGAAKKNQRPQGEATPKPQAAPTPPPAQPEPNDPDSTDGQQDDNE